MIIIIGIIIVITMLMMSMMFQRSIASPIDDDRLSLQSENESLSQRGDPHLDGPRKWVATLVLHV